MQYTVLIFGGLHSGKEKKCLIISTCIIGHIFINVSLMNFISMPVYDSREIKAATVYTWKADEPTDKGVQEVVYM